MIYAETDRLILRAFEESDIDALVRIIGDWDVAKWMVLIPHPYARINAVKYLDKLAPFYAQNEPRGFAICLRDTGALIGALNLKPTYPPRPQLDALEVNYWLGKDYWGFGYMTEAMRGLLSHGFARHGIDKILASTNPANQASQHVLEKCGFTYLGIVPSERPGRLRGASNVTKWEISKETFLKLSEQN